MAIVTAPIAHPSETGFVRATGFPENAEIPKPIKPWVIGSIKSSLIILCKPQLSFIISENSILLVLFKKD
jgi:hypothetical protein